MQLSDYINKMEENSIKAAAERHSCSVDQLIDQFINHINTEISNFGKENFATKYPLENKEDYYSFVKSGYERRRIESIDMLISYLKHSKEEIDNESVMKMYNALNKALRDDDLLEINTLTLDDIKAFLKLIPVSVLFDLEINAFASRDFMIKNVPIIGHYDFFHNILHILYQSLCCFALEDAKIGEKSGIKYREHYNDPESEYYKFVSQEIDKILYISTGSFPEIRTLNIGLPRNKRINESLVHQLHFTLLRVSSIFIWIHEMAHIIHGDLYNDWHKDMEIRCDETAAHCLLNEEQADNSIIIMSLDWLFFFMHLIKSVNEKVRNTDNNKSNAIWDRGKRLNQLIYDKMSEEDKKRYNYYSKMTRPLLYAT